MIVCSLPNPFDRSSRRVWYAEAGRTVEEMAPENVRSEAAFAMIDGERVERSEWGARSTSGARFLGYVNVPTGAELAALSLGEFLAIQFFVAAAVSFLTAILFPPPGPPKQRDDESSPTYGFGGIGNNRFEGLPIPKPYGELRLGGQIINEFVEATGGKGGGPNQTVLYMLIALGEGEMEEIAGQTVDTPNDTPLTGLDLEGVELNGNAIENFDDVEGWVRMGTLEQESIAGFHRLYTPNGMALALEGDETSNSDNSSLYVVGNPYNTDWDGDWDEYGEAFDITAEIDGAILRVRFPTGLFTAGINGAFDPAYFRAQIRYIELDGSNNPISTGGPNGDGYVRVEPSPLVEGAQRDIFEREFDVRFLDPQTWVAPTLGKAVDGAGAGGWASAPLLNNNNPYYDGANAPDAWTASVWFRLRSAFPTGDVGDEIVLFGNHNGTDNRGFSLAFVHLGANSTDWHLNARVEGDLGRLNARNNSDSTDLVVGQWYMATLTYGRDKGDNPLDDRLRLYLNEGLEGEVTDDPSTFKLTKNTVNRAIRFLRSYNPPDIVLDAELDDAVIYDFEFGSGFVLDRFTRKTSGPNHPNFIARWRFDDADPADQDVTIGGDKWFDDATMQSGATTGVSDGIVGTAASGTLKRSKYRVEMLRLNFDSTSNNTFDEAELANVQQYVDEDLCYPGMALLGLRLIATDQLNTTEPTVTTLGKWSKVPVWDGVSEQDPTFVKEWSANPAWVEADIITNRDTGLGEFFDLSNIDVSTFGPWSSYADQVVYDGTTQRFFDAATSWGDIYFDSTGGGGRGVLQFLWSTSPNPGNIPPSNFTPGTYMRVHGIGTVATFDEVNSPLDSDPEGPGGYEVVRTFFNTTFAAWAVEVYWDRAGDVPWTDMTLRQTHSPALAATDWIEGGEKRFQFNGNFDKEFSAWDAMLEVCGVGRATPIPDGNKIRAKFESPRGAVTLIGRGSILDGSFRVEYTGPADKPNSLDLSFLDRDLGYERNSWVVNDGEVDNANSAVQLRRESAFVFGSTTRGQVDRQGTLILNANRLLRRVGRFSVGVEGLHLEIGDVVLISHDLLPRGVSGRVKDGFTSHTSFIVDTPFTLETGKTYKVYQKDWRNQAPLDGSDTRPTGADLEVADLLSPSTPGDYPAGTTVLVNNGPHASGGFTSVPRVGSTSWCIVEDGNELKAEIVEIRLEEDLSRTCRWVQYEDDVFLDSSQADIGDDNCIIAGIRCIDPEDPGAGFHQGGPSGNSGPGRDSDDRIPDDVAALTVRDFMPRDRGIGRRPKLHVTWRHARRSRHAAAKVEVYVRKHRAWLQDAFGGSVTASGVWQLGATVRGESTYADVTLPRGAESGTEYEVAVRPVTAKGVGRRPGLGAMARHIFLGGVSEPRPLSSPAATMEANEVVYSWTPPTPREDETAVEIRRGGWILGQVVYVSSPGERQSPPITDWAGGVGTLKPSLWFAARDAGGHYGDPVELAAFEPSPDLDGFDFPMDNHTQAWEEYADGWKTDSTPPAGDPTLTNLQRNTAGYLEFSGGTTGTYEAANNEVGLSTVMRSGRPLRALVEASVIAWQIHPRVWDSAGSWGDPEELRWTWEGPRYLVSGEDAVTLKIQWRRTLDGVTWLGWEDFKPGQYELVDAQFRLRCTRPDTTYDIEIRSFSTRVRVPAPKALDRGTGLAMLEGELF